MLNILCFFGFHIYKDKNVYNNPPHNKFTYCLNCHKEWQGWEGLN